MPYEYDVGMPSYANAIMEELELLEEGLQATANPFFGWDFRRDNLMVRLDTTGEQDATLRLYRKEFGVMRWGDVLMKADLPGAKPEAVAFMASAMLKVGGHL